MRSLKIGNLVLKNRLFLAPMVDVTDLPYRLICRKSGAGIAYTEMINIGAILHENEKTLRMLKTSKKDTPLGIQITGKSVNEFRDVLGFVGKNKGFDLVDVNCGCPSSRIIGNDSGSYLLKSPDKIRKVVEILKDSGLNVTAKVRLGFKRNNVLKVAKAVEKGGADLLTVHARLSNQGNDVPADWKWISKLKEKIGIPIVGNGDIDSGPKAAEMLDICDGAMIARAAIGNPLIFSEVLYYLKTGKEKNYRFKRRVRLFGDYLKSAKKFDVVEIPRIKFLGGYFLRNFGNAAKKRAELAKLNRIDEIEDFVKNIS